MTGFGDLKQDGGGWSDRLELRDPAVRYNVAVGALMFSFLRRPSMHGARAASGAGVAESSKSDPLGAVCGLWGLDRTVLQAGCGPAAVSAPKVQMHQRYLFGHVSRG